MRIGFHVSIEGSIDKAVDRAVEHEYTTFQLFTRNPRQWKPKKLTEKEIGEFVLKSKSYDLKPIVSHMPYLPNLASPKPDVYKKSYKTLISELKRCKTLEIPYLVTHLGSHLGKGKNFGLKRLISAVNNAIKFTGEDVMLLLENTAGTRNSIGECFEEIQYIINRITKPEIIGVCFDTSHAFAAGYDLRTLEAVRNMIQILEETVSFDIVKVVHLNDSKRMLNSKIDRHEHIGMGYIGVEGFSSILKSKFGQLPLILETPKDERRSDIKNIHLVKKLFKLPSQKIRARVYD